MTALPTPPTAGGAGLALTRRDVLIGAAAAALAATSVGRLAARLPAGDGSLFSLATGAGPRISVGFLPDAAGALPAGGRVVPAATVVPGGLPGRAMARIAGPTPGMVEGLPYAGLRLDALFPLEDADQPARFHAWTLRSDPPSVSPPVRFTAPVGDMSLGFELTVIDDDGERSAVSVMTAADSDIPLPRLRTGTYLLGLRPHVWDEAATLPAASDPAWHDLASLLLTVRSDR